ncbi:MAG: hypothetical protein JWO46_2678 [Nocardioidaceae bacterium]|nr:hypothetical protein [Nocardioidaceae bacterium]
MTDAALIPWAKFTHDPRPSENAALRASDADRALALDVLSNGYADGRLDRDEYDERSTTLQSAKTLGDLVGPIRDLAPDHQSLVPSNPEALQAKAEDRYAQVRAGALATFFGPSLVCWVIWAVVLIGGGGTWFPWPIFVSLGTITRLIQVTINKRAIIEEQKKKIEREELRAIERKPR